MAARVTTKGSDRSRFARGTEGDPDVRVQQSGGTFCTDEERFFLNQFDYAGKDTSVVYEPDPLIVRRGREAVGD